MTLCVDIGRITLTPILPAGAREYPARPFDGANVHWTFATTPSHLPSRERENLNKLLGFPHL